MARAIGGVGVFYVGVFYVGVMERLDSFGIFLFARYEYDAVTVVV